MHVTHLLLRNFRNYEEAEIPLSPDVNTIYGKNGAGKTTLLEALVLMSTGRSFLTSRLSELIREGSSHFYVEARFVKEGVEQMLSVGFDGSSRKIHYNATAYHTFSHVLGILPSVLYSPKDSALISGAPQERRRFLNIQLAQTDPLYVHHLVRYQKALKHRNALLKMGSTSAIETWEKMMADSARYLMEKRRALIEALSPQVNTFGALLSNEQDTFHLRYTPSIGWKHLEEIHEVYEKSRKKELFAKTTLLGPHRDDFEIVHQNREAKGFASEGQKRTCIAALKLAEWQELKKEADTTPLFAIDDFGIHLDPTRTHILQSHLSDLGQVLLTSPLVGEEGGLHIDQGKLLQKIP